MIASLIQKSFAQQARTLGISRSEWPQYVAFDTEQRVRWRMKSGVHVALACYGADVCGTVSWTGHPEEAGLGEITRLAVLPPQRGQGYGRLLMSYAEKKLRNAGAVAAELSIVRRFERLRLYYEALGYSVREVKRVPVLPFELLFLRKALLRSEVV